MRCRCSRPWFLAAAALLLGACSVIQADPWDWLFDPAEQAWREVVVHGYGREVRFKIPDRSKRGGEHVRTWPREWESVVPADYDPFVPAFQAQWDSYWGGFYKSGDVDFTLSLRFVATKDAVDLLDLNIEQLVERTRSNYIGTLDPTNTRRNEYIIPRYWVKAHSTPHHAWVHANMPQVTADHEEYSMAYSDHMELQFRFFVRAKRWDVKDDPEWSENRWAIVRQIMDTVQVLPAP